MVKPRTERWRVVFRRLPLTLAVLAVVGGGAAGLAYVASGSGAHRFPATLQNDLGRPVELGECEEDDCTPGGMLVGYRLDAGQKLRVGLRTSVINPILITTPESKRIGCLFLRYAEEPATTPLILLSASRPC